MKQMKHGVVPERAADYPGSQPTTAQMQSAQAWSAFMNGGFQKDRVPFSVLREMAKETKTFEEKFRQLSEPRKLEFMKFFWVSADARDNKNEPLSQQMADAVAVMRDNEPFRAFPGPKSEPLMVC